MKSSIKKLINKVFSPINERIQRVEVVQDEIKNDLKLKETNIMQVSLKNQYRNFKLDEIIKTSFREIGFRVFSQNKEDGILLFIFSIIGAKSKICVEMCAGDGIQSNTANLIINHGWNGLLFDGDAEAVRRGDAFFKRHPDTFSFPPKFVNAWITKNNVNDLITYNGVQGEIDLLSLDLDGVDYWIWNAITVINPRVVVAEVQCIWGNRRSVTVPYSDDFRTEYLNGFGVYSGASLPAFMKLAKQKGYRLIGVEEYGFNAFFMRNDVGIDCFPEKEIQSCINLPFVNWAQQEFLHLIKDKPWVEV